MFLFHGSEDVTVPYGTAPHHFCKAGSSGYMMLFGSYPIYEKAKTLNSTVDLFTYCGGNHGYSSYVIEKEPSQILNFIKDVIDGKKRQAHRIFPTNYKSPIADSLGFCQ